MSDATSPAIGFTNLPGELEHLTPYLVRATELVVRDPVVSFFCKQYVVQKGMKFAKGNKQVEQFLQQVLDDLEKMKEGLKSNPEFNTATEVAKPYIANFALRIFQRADDECYARLADRKTIRKFLASACFMDVLEVFGEIDPSIRQKAKYARWKAADVTRALNEGRIPEPGPPRKQLEHDAMDETNEDTGIPGVSPPTTAGFVDIPHPESELSARVAPTPFTTSAYTEPRVPSQVIPAQGTQESRQQPGGRPPIPSSQNTSPTFPQLSPRAFHGAPNDLNSVAPATSSYHQAPVSPHLASRRSQRGHSEFPPAMASGTAVGGGGSGSGTDYDPNVIQNAQKYAKWAASALLYDDVPTAIQNLDKSLGLLERYR